MVWLWFEYGGVWFSNFMKYDGVEEEDRWWEWFIDVLFKWVCRRLTCLLLEKFDFESLYGVVLVERSKICMKLCVWCIFIWERRFWLRKWSRKWVSFVWCQELRRDYWKELYEACVRWKQKWWRTSLQCCYHAFSFFFIPFWERHYLLWSMHRFFAFVSLVFFLPVTQTLVMVSIVWILGSSIFIKCPTYS